MGFLIAIITLTCNTRQWVQRILTSQTLLLCYSKGWEKENNKILTFEKKASDFQGVAFLPHCYSLNH